MWDEAEPRRTMRLVTVSPTGMGEVVWERRAAAAAALDRLVLLSRLRTKAFEAAREAEGLGAVCGGCRQGSEVSSWTETRGLLAIKGSVQDWTQPCAGETWTLWISNY